MRDVLTFLLIVSLAFGALRRFACDAPQFTRKVAHTCTSKSVSKHSAKLMDDAQKLARNERLLPAAAAYQSRDLRERNADDPISQTPASTPFPIPADPPPTPSPADMSSLGLQCRPPAPTSEGMSHGALLEIFTLESPSTRRWSPQPAITTYWRNPLRCADPFLLPDRLAEIGLGKRYWARFSFYLEAKQPGPYEFTVQHSRMNDCYLRLLGVDVVKSERRTAGFPWHPSSMTDRGICMLNKGRYRVEFWLLSNAQSRAHARGSAVFEVTVIVPGARDAVFITAEMMNL